MQPAIHDPYVDAGPSARERAAARRERLARIARRAFAPPAPAKPNKIEIREYDCGETSIEVTACNGQIVIVTEAQIAEARAIFERVDVFEGGAKTSIDKIQRAVCRKFRITRVDLLSQRRTLRHVIPRQVAMYLCKIMTFKSLPEIGRRFNGKDHTTVLHAVRKMTALVEKDEKIRDTVTAIQFALNAEVE